MSEQADRAQVTVRCRHCRTALARMTPTSAAFRWQVDRLDRVPWVRQPARVGVTRVGDPRFGVAANDGTLPSPRMLPVRLDGDEAPLACRRCGLASSAELRELRARADRAERRSKAAVLWP
jgi:hypothetical protein